MIWLAFARKYAWVLAAAALVSIILYGISRALNKAEQRGYAAATAQMAIRVAKANAETAALEQRQRERTQKAAESWESQRNDLQSQVDRLLTVTSPAIRVCRSAGAAPVSKPGSPAGSFDGATVRPVDAVSMGPDIGGAAILLAGECERYRAQLSALQAWISSR